MKAKQDLFYKLLNGPTKNLEKSLELDPGLILREDEIGMTLLDHSTRECYEMCSRAGPAYTVILREAMKQGIDFNKPIYNGRTLLQKAVSECDNHGINNTRILLSTIPDLDIDATSSSGMTALCYALRYCNLSAAKTLIEADAEVNMINNPHQAPIIQLELLKKYFQDALKEPGAWISHCEDRLKQIEELKQLITPKLYYYNDQEINEYVHQLSEKNQLIQNQIKGFNESCSQIKDRHPEQIKLKNRMLQEIKLIRHPSVEELSQIVEKTYSASNRINKSEAKGFFPASQSELANKCKDFVDLITNQSKIIAMQREDNESNEKKLNLINDVVCTVFAQFGEFKEINGNKLPLGGLIFSGSLGKEPSFQEQNSRAKFIEIANRYTNVRANNATLSLIELKIELKNELEDLSKNETSDSIARGAQIALCVAYEDPLILVKTLLFLQVLKQIATWFFELVSSCFPDFSTQEDPNPSVGSSL
ncbi:MAG: ankyrin repeat domain-containing protein [Tatlockia sp.]|nr:ankyrin repeat domain-containing protein [Tatlockia sp.]